MQSQTQVGLISAYRHRHWSFESLWKPTSWIFDFAVFALQICARIAMAYFLPDRHDGTMAYKEWNGRLWLVMAHQKPLHHCEKLTDSFLLIHLWFHVPLAHSRHKVCFRPKARQVLIHGSLDLVFHPFWICKIYIQSFVYKLKLSPIELKHTYIISRYISGHNNDSIQSHPLYVWHSASGRLHFQWLPAIRMQVVPLNPPRLSRQSQHVDIVSSFSFCCWVFICVRIFVDVVFILSVKWLFWKELGFASAGSGVLVLANTLLGGSGLLGMPAALAQAGDGKNTQLHNLKWDVRWQSQWYPENEEPLLKKSVAKLCDKHRFFFHSLECLFAWRVSCLWPCHLVTSKKCCVTDSIDVARS